MSRLLRASSGIDEILAHRVADVLRRGLYEVVPQSDVEQAIIDDEPDAPPIDLNYAASLLRCDRARDKWGELLPDVVFSWGCSAWIHYDGIAEGHPIRDRIRSVGCQHAEYAADVLIAPHADRRRVAELVEIQHAIAMSCTAPLPGDPLVIEAATPWTTLTVNRVVSSGSVEELSPLAQQPDEDLRMLAPQIAWAGMADPMGVERGTIRIDVFQSHLHHDDAPDPVTVMRTMLDLKAHA